MMCSGDLHKIDTKARLEGWTAIELAEWRRDFNQELSDHHLISRDYDPWNGMLPSKDLWRACRMHSGGWTTEFQAKMTETEKSQAKPEWLRQMMIRAMLNRFGRMPQSLHTSHPGDVECPIRLDLVTTSPICKNVINRRLINIMLFCRDGFGREQSSYQSLGVCCVLVRMMVFKAVVGDVGDGYWVLQ